MSTGTGDLVKIKRRNRFIVKILRNRVARYADLEQKIAALQGENEQTAATLKDVERRLSDMALLFKNITTYKELKPLYDEYKKSRDKEKYLRGHESEIILFEAAAKALKASGVDRKLPDPAKLKAEYKRLTAEKDALYTEYGKLKKQLREYDAVKQNIDSILHPARRREQEKAL